MLPKLVEIARFFAEDSAKRDKNNLKAKSYITRFPLLKAQAKRCRRNPDKGNNEGKIPCKHSAYEGSSTEGAVLSRIKAIASQIHAELPYIDSQNIYESQACKF